MLTPDQTRLRLQEQENRRLKAEVDRLRHNYKVALKAVLNISKATLRYVSGVNRRTVEENIKYIQERLDKE